MSSDILVVDDDDDAREALMDALRSPDIEVFGAADGQEALDLIHRDHVCPSLIVLDLMMPVMNGIAFLQHQEVDPHWSGVPVVVVTSETSVGEELVGSVLAVLPKPLPLDRLRELVASVCNEPQSSSTRAREPWHDATGDRAAAPGQIERRRNVPLQRPAPH